MRNQKEKHAANQFFSSLLRRILVEIYRSLILKSVQRVCVQVRSVAVDQLDIARITLRSCPHAIGARRATDFAAGLSSLYVFQSVLTAMIR